MSYCPFHNMQCREDCQLFDRQSSVCLLTILSAELISLIDSAVTEVPDEDNDTD